MAWLIDLSFSLGQPAHLLAQMPLNWLLLYQQYTAEHGLPHWREEMQLARIAMSLDALRFPAAHLSIEQYLIRPSRGQAVEEDSSPPSEAEADAICAALGLSARARHD